MKRELTINESIRFKEMISELLGDKYKIVTHDGGLSYSLFEKNGNGASQRTIYSCTPWFELCITIIPETLGMRYLVFPISDPTFNLAEYMINYYNEMKSKFDEKISTEILNMDLSNEDDSNPYALDGSH